MYEHQQNACVDIDLGRPPVAFQFSPTYRFHIHDFERHSYSIDSPFFYCFGQKWSVWIRPESNSGQVSFSLRCHSEVGDDSDSDSSSDDSDVAADYNNRKSLKIQFTAGVKNQDGEIIKSRTKTHFYRNSCDIKGIRDLMKREDIIDPSNNILDNGSLTIELQMELLEKSNAICQPFFPPNPLVQNMGDLFLDEATADVVFAVVEGGETTNFHAHRLLLRSTNLFNVCDSSSYPTPVVISRVDPKVFKLMLCYIYGGTIAISEWKLYSKELIDAADFYGVINLKLMAEAKYVMNTTISTDNALELLVYADSKQCAHLKEAVMDFIVQNKNEVLKRVASSRSVPESSTMFTDLLAAMARGDETMDDNDTESIDTMRVGALRRKLHEKGLEIDGSREALVSRLKASSEKRAGGKRSRSSQGEDPQNEVVEID